MKKKAFVLFSLFLTVSMVSFLFHGEDYFHPEFGKLQSGFGISQALAYPPGVGILTNSRNCLSCHANNGPWKDDSNTIIDILDKDSKKSLRQDDGSFLITTKRYEAKMVYTVIGRKDIDGITVPDKTAWIYIDTSMIGKNSLSKFAPNWEVNLQLSCRITGDKIENYTNSTLTSLPMTIRPLTTAKDENIMLQVLLSKGNAEKNNAKNSLMSNYFERVVRLKIQED